MLFYKFFATKNNSLRSNNVESNRPRSIFLVWTLVKHAVAQQDTNGEVVTVRVH